MQIQDVTSSSLLSYLLTSSVHAVNKTREISVFRDLMGLSLPKLTFQVSLITVCLKHKIYHDFLEELFACNNNSSKSSLRNLQHYSLLWKFVVFNLNFALRVFNLKLVFVCVFLCCCICYLKKYMTPLKITVFKAQRMAAQFYQPGGYFEQPCTLSYLCNVNLI